MTAHAFTSLVNQYAEATRLLALRDIDNVELEAALKPLFNRNQEKHQNILRIIANETERNGFCLQSIASFMDLTNYKLPSITQILIILEKRDLIHRFKTNEKATRMSKKYVFVANWEAIGYKPEKMARKAKREKIKTIDFVDFAQRELAIRLVNV